MASTSTPDGPRAPIVEVALAVALRADRVLVLRRAPGSHLAGTWEFPRGKIRDGEAPDAAARRELAEETGLRATALEPLVVLTHDYPDRAVRLHCFVTREPSGDVEVESSRPCAWVAVQDLARLNMPEANVSIVRALAGRTARGAHDAG